ncbi:hypothetical protein M406DRAFT_263248 [Cryphonectria parasitica EP155]|uniref:Zn(2)-C6 fungal-type domain-containing protein n=1 Tax=Cryphonectria parasitica (strain ATCC 38755 / EP155) TaxID=660469 RepID=A0A9P5CKI5_CRYP1|nr:uncharacterized protein M406DRAFT_263248 [Cryphonectria parasitica EP155]KAF3762108.1 hypothetical protein M406DRAFT_263248 [Cryphonectria parasitica EP155]
MEGDNTSEDVQDERSPPPKRRNKIRYPKKRVAVACEVCRSRRTRCDAARPACSFCSQLGIECVYRRQPADVRTHEDKDKVDYNEDIVCRLQRIEQLLSRDLRDRSSPYHAPRPPIRHETPDATLSQHPTPVVQFEYGIHLNNLARLAGQACPAALEPLCLDNTEEQLEMLMQQGDSLFSNPCKDIHELDLSSWKCWQLQRSFITEALPFCPIIEQHDCAAIIERNVEKKFEDNGLEASLALFMLALGEISRQSHYTNDENLPGSDYFQAGCRLLDAEQRSANTLLLVQCHIFEAFCWLHWLRPLQAHKAIQAASSKVTILLSLPKLFPENSPAREQCHRALWACYLIELELQPYVSRSGHLLQNWVDDVPLPLSNYDEPGMFWFLSEIALRRIYSNPRNGINSNNTFTVFAPLVVDEISNQILGWHATLAAPVAFPLHLPGHESQNLEEIRLLPHLDPHKAFLRTQFYALQTILHWPYVLRLLTSRDLVDWHPSESEYASTVRGAMKSIHYAVLSIYSAEPLMHNRHLMLLETMTGVFYLTMMLAATFQVPELAAAQHPKGQNAIWLGLKYLKVWEENSSIAYKVCMVESLLHQRCIEPSR